MSEKALLINTIFKNEKDILEIETKNVEVISFISETNEWTAWPAWVAWPAWNDWDADGV